MENHAQPVGFVRSMPTAEVLDSEEPVALEAEELHRSQHAITVEASPDEVWTAFTDDDELSSWLGDAVELDVVPGGEGQVIDDDGVLRRIRVEDVDEGRSIRWSWWPEADEDRATVVEITIEPMESGSEVRVVETAPVACGSGGWSGRLVSLELCLLVQSELVAVRPVARAGGWRPTGGSALGLSRSVMLA